MIKNTLFIAVFICSSLLSFSQDEEKRSKKFDQLKAKKIAYITDEVSLTAKQAEKFWPIYNAHENLKKEKFGDRKGRMKDLNSFSESESSNLLEEQLKKEDQMLLERKKYVTSLRTVISDKQILLLLDAEKKFRREVFSRYKDRKNRRKGKENRQRQERKSNN